MNNDENLRNWVTDNNVQPHVWQQQPRVQQKSIFYTPCVILLLVQRPDSIVQESYIPLQSNVTQPAHIERQKPNRSFEMYVYYTYTRRFAQHLYILQVYMYLCRYEYTAMLQVY